MTETHPIGTGERLKRLEDAPVGSIVWHCSDEDSGPDVGVSIKLGDNELLWCGEITHKLYVSAECQGYASEDGWWIIHYVGSESTVIAKCFDADAAHALFELLGSRIRRETPAPLFVSENNGLRVENTQTPATLRKDEDERA